MFPNNYAKASPLIHYHYHKKLGETTIESPNEKSVNSKISKIHTSVSDQKSQKSFTPSSIVNENKI